MNTDLFIVAECGVNWRDLEDAGHMILQAKLTGADAVKFQVYKQEHVAGHPREKELVEKILDADRLAWLSQHAQGCGIEFFATPMYVEAVDMLEKVGVKRYKIRYKDWDNDALVGEVRRRKKPIFVSIEARQEQRFVVLWTSEDAPMPLCGLSNHIPSIAAPLWAIAHGMTYIEVHVQFDNYYGGYAPIDSDVSLTFSQLAEVCRIGREMHRLCS